MNDMPDWLVLTLIFVVLLLSGGFGGWLGIKYLVGKFIAFINRYSRPD